MDVRRHLEERAAAMACYAALMYGNDDSATAAAADDVTASRYRRPASGNTPVSHVVSAAKRLAARRQQREQEQQQQQGSHTAAATADTRTLQLRTPLRTTRAHAVLAAAASAAAHGTLLASSSLPLPSSTMATRVRIKARQRRVLACDAWRRLLRRKRRLRVRARRVTRRRRARRQMQLRYGKATASRCVCVCSCVACVARHAAATSSSSSSSRDVVWLPSHQLLCTRLQAVTRCVRVSGDVVHTRAALRCTCAAAAAATTAAAASVHATHRVRDTASMTAHTTAPVAVATTTTTPAPPSRRRRCCFCRTVTRVHVRVHVRCKRRCHRALQRWACALTAMRSARRQPLARVPPASLLVDLSHYCVYRIDTTVPCTCCCYNSSSCSNNNGDDARNKMHDDGGSTRAQAMTTRKHLQYVAKLLNSVAAKDGSDEDDVTCVGHRIRAAAAVTAQERTTRSAHVEDGDGAACGVVCTHGAVSVLHAHMWAASPHGDACGGVVPVTLVAYTAAEDEHDDDDAQVHAQAACADATTTASARGHRTRVRVLLVSPCAVHFVARLRAHARVALVSQWSPCARTQTAASLFELWTHDGAAATMTRRAAPQAADALPLVIRHCATLLQRVLTTAATSTPPSAAQTTTLSLVRRRGHAARTMTAAAAHQLLLVPALPHAAAVRSDSNSRRVCLTRCVWLLLFVSTTCSSSNSRSISAVTTTRPRVCRRADSSNVLLRRAHYWHARRLHSALARGGAYARRSSSSDDTATTCVVVRSGVCRVIGLRERAALLRQLCRPVYPDDYVYNSSNSNKGSGSSVPSLSSLMRIVRCHATLSNASCRVCVRARDASRRLPCAHARRGAWLLCVHHMTISSRSSRTRASLYTVARVGVVTSTAYFAARLGCCVAPVWCLFPHPHEHAGQPWRVVQHALCDADTHGASNYSNNNSNNNNNSDYASSRVWYCLSTRRDARRLLHLSAAAAHAAAAAVDDEVAVTASTAVAKASATGACRRKRQRCEADIAVSASTQPRATTQTRCSQLVTALCDAQCCTPVELLVLHV